MYIEEYLKQVNLTEADIERVFDIKDTIEKQIENAVVTDTLVSDLHFILDISRECGLVNDPTFVRVQKDIAQVYNINVEDMRIYAMDMEGVIGSIVDGIISLIKGIIKFIGSIFGLCDKTSNSSDNEKEDKIDEALNDNKVLNNLEELAKASATADNAKTAKLIKRLYVEISAVVEAKNKINKIPISKTYINTLDNIMSKILNDGILDIGTLKFPHHKTEVIAGKIMLNVLLGVSVNLEKNCDTCEVKTTYTYLKFQNMGGNIIDISIVKEVDEVKTDLTKPVKKSDKISTFFKRFITVKKEKGLDDIKKKADNNLKIIEKLKGLNDDELIAHYEHFYKSWSTAKGIDVDALNEEELKKHKESFRSIVMNIIKVKSIMLKDVGTQLLMLVRIREKLYKTLKDLEYIK